MGPVRKRNTRGAETSDWEKGYWIRRQRHLLPWLRKGKTSFIRGILRW